MLKHQTLCSSFKENSKFCFGGSGMHFSSFYFIYLFIYLLLLLLLLVVVVVVFYHYDSLTFITFAVFR